MNDDLGCFGAGPPGSLTGVENYGQGRGAALAAKLTHEAYRDDVRISAGTDGFSADADPWPTLQDELELLQNQAGMRPKDVIYAATAVGAAAVGQEANMGALQPGLLANMVFTTSNPLFDVSAFRTVVLTVKRGRAYWRADFTHPPAKGFPDGR